MEERERLLTLIRMRATERILFSQHAVRQMARPDRMISTSEIRQVLEQGEVIEDYPDNAGGHSCLIMGNGIGGRPVHIVCSPKDQYLAVITAYLPTQDEWSDNFRVRMKP